MRNAIYWAEIPVENFERAKTFYETIFDVEINLVPFPRGKYGVFPLDTKQLGAGAGIVQGDNYEPSTKGTLVYLDRGDTDLNAVLSKVEKAGGKILLPKTNNEGFGYIAQFTDTEGNKIGLHSMK